MNKTININLGGILFHIEENAYEKLNLYLQSIKTHFKNLEGGDEIIADIEVRLSEIFQENLKKGQQALTLVEIDGAIKAMGDPKDFDETHTSEVQPSSERKHKRRLFRDPDDQLIAGVCSGLSAYFGLNTRSIRFVFLILLVWGPGLPLYIVLWLVMPLAKTRAEKLELHGKEVNISTIQMSVKESRDNPAPKSCKQKWCVAGIICGCILCAGPIWTLAIAWERSVPTSGIADPSILASDVGSALSLGIIALFAGIALLAFSFRGLRRCKEEELVQAGQL